MLDGLRCGACVWLIERTLAAQPGVTTASVNFATERAVLEDKLAQTLSPAEIAECGRALKAGNEETAQLEERWLEISTALEEISAAAVG